jgi:hypothetical protein
MGSANKPASDPRLVLNVRNRGLNQDRHISGDCSACGDTLLASLADGESGGVERLRDKLDKVFEQHVADFHSKKTAL